MREILFRGKRIDGSEWIEGDLIHSLGRTYCGIFAETLGQVDANTVGQYTGLTEADGTRIFEGDIVSGLFRFGMKKNALVTFKDGAFGLEWYRGGIAHFDAFTSICNVKYQVLGNIHDNPELLFKED